MSRGTRVLLVISLALNVSLLSAVVTLWVDARFGPRTPPALAGSEPAPPPELDAPGRGWGRGRGHRDRGAFGPGETILQHWPGRRIERLAEAVGLSAEQRAVMKEQLDELRPRIQAVASGLDRERRELHRALRDGALDGAEIRGRMNRVARLQGSLDSLVTEAMIREGEILSEEQRQRIAEMEWGPGCCGPPRP